MGSGSRDDSGFGELLALGSRVWRLMADPRVPRRLKAIPVLSLVYVLSPIDLVPDAVPGLAQIDDLAVVLIGLRLFLSLAGPHVAEPPAGAGSRHEEPEVVDASWRVR